MPAEGFVVAVVRDPDTACWQAYPLPNALLDDLDALLAALRQQAGEGGVIGLVDVADDFFVAIRIPPQGAVRLLLSDATAAAEWDLARQVLERLHEEPPDDDDLDEVWPAGDLGIFRDLGLPEMELGAIVDELDLYADEMLLGIVHRLGFTSAYEAALGTVPH